MKTKTSMELEAQRAVLLRQVKRIGPLVEGSLARVPRKCGSVNCPCQEGVVKHEALILCKKVAGRSVATYVPKELWESVRAWNQEHKRIKRVLKEISKLSEQIIRLHVKEKQRVKRGRRSMKVLTPESDPAMEK
jgi:hypothetical protein